MNEIFQKIYNKHIPENIAKYHRSRFKCSEDMDDFVQEMYCQFLEIKTSTLHNLLQQGEKTLENYFAKMCFNQIQNIKSTFNKKMQNDITKIELTENYDQADE